MDLLTEFNIAELSLLIANKMHTHIFGELPKSFDNYMLLKEKDGTSNIISIKHGSTYKSLTPVDINSLQSDRLTTVPVVSDKTITAALNSRAAKPVKVTATVNVGAQKVTTIKNDTDTDSEEDIIDLNDGLHKKGLSNISYLSVQNSDIVDSKMTESSHSLNLKRKIATVKPGPSPKNRHLQRRRYPIKVYGPSEKPQRMCK